MKKDKLFLCFLMFLFILSCQSKKKTSLPEVKKEETNISNVSIQPFFFEIGFFKYKSTSISDVKDVLESRKEELQKAISSIPEGQKVIIKGHADARGPEAPKKNKPGNIYLSEKRAKNVAEWLIKNANLKENSYIIEAKGSSELKKPNSPYDSENRRVEIIFK